MQIKEVFTEEELFNCPYLAFMNYRFTSDSIHLFRYNRKGIEKSFSSKSFHKAKVNATEFAYSLLQNNGQSERIIKLVEYGEKWLDIVKKPYVNKDTYRTYKTVFNLYIRPAFLQKTFNAITLFDLQEFFNNLDPEKGKTRETIKIVMNGIYKSAYSEDIIQKDFMTCVNVKKHIRKTGKCLTQDDLTQFLENIKGDKKELSYRVMLYSGVRPSELESIVFDWENNTMTIDNGKLKDYQKTCIENMQRTIPIFPLLHTLKARLTAEDWKINPRTLSCKFHMFCPNYRLYDLRHTFVTRSKECGVSDELVSLWTGHTLGKTVTAKIYTHYDMETQQKEALKIAY